MKHPANAHSFAHALDSSAGDYAKVDLAQLASFLERTAHEVLHRTHTLGEWPARRLAKQAATFEFEGDRSAPNGARRAVLVLTVGTLLRHSSVRMLGCAHPARPKAHEPDDHLLPASGDHGFVHEDDANVRNLLGHLWSLRGALPDAKRLPSNFAAARPAAKRPILH